MEAQYEFAQDRNGEVYVTRMRQPWRIVHIDALLDGISREMKRREAMLKPYSAESWHRAWNKHSDLKARHDALMAPRSIAAEYRDRMTSKARDAEQRRRRIEFQRESRRRFEASKCPTCGAHTLAAA